MRNKAIVLLIILLALPAALLPARPDLAPEWFRTDLAGAPGAMWFIMGWFVLLTLVSWLPFDGDRRP